MIRELKRVPVDFYYPRNLVWCGYSKVYPKNCPNRKKGACSVCRETADKKGICISAHGPYLECPQFQEYFRIPEKLMGQIEPPVGEGYQLWEYTSEGSPMSPVFLNYEDLCSWCENNATIFGEYRYTKEQWSKYLKIAIIMVDICGLRIPLPMSEEILLSDRYNIDSLDIMVQCLHAGILTPKLPEMVRLRDINALAFIIQQFDKGQEQFFYEQIQQENQILPTDALNIALGIHTSGTGSVIKDIHPADEKI